MIWAQVKGGQRLHLALEPGEEQPDGYVVRIGQLSWPLCGPTDFTHYRMTTNVPLANACKNCVRVARARGHL